MSNKTISYGVERVVIVVLCMLAAVAVMLLFVGCSPTKRLTNLHVKYPDAGLKVCASLYPAETKVVRSTEYVMGEAVNHYDTVQIDCDSVVASYRGSHVATSGNVATSRMVRIPCPPSTVRIDTVKLTTNTVTVDTKKVNQLTKDNAGLQAEFERVQGGRNVWRWIAIGALVVVLGGLALKVFGSKIRL